MKFNWGHGILIFMIIFLILSTAFIIFSLKNAQDLVSDDYYNQGADYSNQIEINKRSFNYRDSITINQINSNIQLKLCNSLAGRVEDTLFVYFYSPSSKNSDCRLKFPMADSISIPSSNLKNGRYMVKMSWKTSGELYNIEKEFFLK